MASRYQLYLADYRVRYKIRTCLEKRACVERESRCRDCFKKAAFQLAFCYRMGFGVKKNDEKSHSLLEWSGKSHKDLEHEICLVKQEKLDSLFGEGTFRHLFTLGHDLMVNFAEYYRESQKLDDVQQKYEQEIADIESVLGALHEIPSMLKSILSTILVDQGKWKE